MAWSTRILLPYLNVWLLLKVPALVVAPQMEAVWLGLREIAVLLAGGWILFPLADQPAASTVRPGTHEATGCHTSAKSP